MNKTAFALLLSIAAACASADPGPATDAAPPAPADAGDKKPLVVFIGDSITRGKPTGRPDYKPSEPPPAGHLTAGNYGYFEALAEATAAKDVPFRFDKLGNGGQAITGWIGASARQVLEGRNREIKEKPAILVLQDFYTSGGGEGEAALVAAVNSIVASARKNAPDTRIILSTVVTEPDGTWSGKVAPADVAATNAVLLKTAERLSLPIVRLDLAWERYMKQFKDRRPAADWRLTQHGKYYDGVHPGKVGALFQALVFARELGIGPDQFDQAAAALDVPAAQADAIKRFVYSWAEPTIYPLPAPASQPESSADESEGMQGPGA